MRKVWIGSCGGGGCDNSTQQSTEQMDGVTISIASEPRGEGAVTVVVDVTYWKY